VTTTETSALAGPSLPAGAENQQPRARGRMAMSSTRPRPWEPSNPLHWNGRKTRCVRGHEFDEANTYIRPDGKRLCRACDALAHRIRYWADKAAAS
jgi:hypothetical protein